MDPRRVGTMKENLACDYLQAKGYRILKRNFFCRNAEVDIIAKSPENVLCFVEVKYRKDDRYGKACAAVDHRKRARIVRGARVFLSGKDAYWNMAIRFDVIAIDGEEIQHVQHAFYAEE